jgi:hypothetical protein
VLAIGDRHTAKRTTFVVFEQESATLRADTYHWVRFALRRFQWERTDNSMAGSLRKALQHVVHMRCG